MKILMNGALTELLAKRNHFEALLNRSLWKQYILEEKRFGKLPWCFLDFYGTFTDLCKKKKKKISPNLISVKRLPK